uniref:Uncharacterized protein n=1 Tax=Aegilops tauschii TaxID=37682 RepID=R7W503_AEGTA
MKTGVIVLSVVVAVFGVASAVLGFIAEGTKLTDSGVDRGVVLLARTTQGRGCTYLKDGVFRMGAILSIVATVLGIISYIVLYVAAAAAGAGTTATLGTVAGPSAAGETKHDGIAIGQPAAAPQHSEAV